MRVEWPEYIQQVFAHQFLPIEETKQQSADLDAQEQVEQDKFIVSLG